MRNFVIIGRTALSTEDFRLDDLPGTSGRLDLLLHCVRAALLRSHGLRVDVTVYLLLCAGPLAPRTLRFRGATAKFLRPDERSLAVLAQKVLASRTDPERGFVDVKAGVSISREGLPGILEDLGSATRYVLDAEGDDLRSVDGVAEGDVAFFLGDHLGIDDPVRIELAALGARVVRVGPLVLHAEDVIAIVLNEIDRQQDVHGPGPIRAPTFA